MQASDPSGQQMSRPVETAPSLGEVVYEFPSTIAQRAFWYLDQVERGNPAWNIAVRFRIQGGLDATILEKAINRIAERQDRKSVV